ncbi:Hypothetical predicted protein, partial [Paramuricea clavata]
VDYICRRIFQSYKSRNYMRTKRDNINAATTRNVLNVYFVNILKQGPEVGPLYNCNILCLQLWLISIDSGRHCLYNVRR